MDDSASPARTVTVRSGYQDKQTLPHGQPVRLPQAVIARKEPRRERKRPADGIQRITGLYHIDLHTITSQNPMRRTALVFRYFIWYKYCGKIGNTKEYVP